MNVHSVHFNVQKNVHTPDGLDIKTHLFRIIDNISTLLYTLSMYMYSTCTFSLYSDNLKFVFWEVIK